MENMWSSRIIEVHSHSALKGCCCLALCCSVGQWRWGVGGDGDGGGGVPK